MFEIVSRFLDTSRAPFAVDDVVKNHFAVARGRERPQCGVHHTLCGPSSGLELTGVHHTVVRS